MLKYFIAIFFFSALSISTSQAGIETYSLKDAKGEQLFEGHWISKGKKAPLIFIVHDWDGLTEYEIKRSKMLTDLGYSVFAVDLFGRGVRPSLLEDKKKQTGALYTNRERMREILNAA